VPHGGPGWQLKTAITTAVETLKTKRPAGHQPDEIDAMLDAVPDLRKALKTASDEQLADIFRAFGATARLTRRSRWDHTESITGGTGASWPPGS
jgi:hypothetical protein